MIETVLALLCVSSWFLTWKFSRSWILTSIIFLISIPICTYIVDEHRKQQLQNAMRSEQQQSICGNYLGFSTVERGSKNNKWQQTVFHFQTADGEKYHFPESDLLKLSGEHQQFLEQPPQAFCLTFAQDYSDNNGFYLLTSIHFNKK
ncbi:hypothetical protein [Acinetobacter tianfuensis]|uniref:Uncharacterized protein n=1 Tax=Acinetobacter tianfuensis TaxID=2419603 RepID=A0A3A8E4G4_9GAMM|nr:hypothetical protein [Acinetobacter tianfuensis]RKG29038.1 hypothetical protein D7V32_16795 [Acinetobacter tianfuensis]